MKNKILILGPQGSGKGTQAKILSEKLELPALSMGDLLRAEIASETNLGLKLKDIVNRGELVSDDIALDVLKVRLQRSDAENGYIIDGYPRNLAQFRAFNGFDVPTILIVVTVPTEETLKRLLKRAEVEGRADDNKETIMRRLDIYHNDTEPIINEYQKLGIVREVDGVGSIEEVSERIRRVFEV